jgi:hypothetical protein
MPTLLRPPGFLGHHIVITADLREWEVGLTFGVGPTLVATVAAIDGCAAWVPYSGTAQDEVLAAIVPVIESMAPPA